MALIDASQRQCGNEAGLHGWSSECECVGMCVNLKNYMYLTKMD